MFSFSRLILISKFDNVSYDIFLFLKPNIHAIYFITFVFDFFANYSCVSRNISLLVYWRSSAIIWIAYSWDYFNFPAYLYCHSISCVSSKYRQSPYRPLYLFLLSKPRAHLHRNENIPIWSSSPLQRPFVFAPATEWTFPVSWICTHPPFTVCRGNVLVFIEMIFETFPLFYRLLSSF